MQGDLSSLRERAQFTKGPWHIVPYGDGNSLVICTEPDGNWRICFLATPGDSSGAWATIKSDARLIAAAPEMFEALVRGREFVIQALGQLVEIEDFDPTEHLVVKQIDAALLRALSARDQQDGGGG